MEMFNTATLKMSLYACVYVYTQQPVVKPDN